MRFGIWVEPEAVNPGSDVLLAHPDWVYRAGDRPLVTVRGNQYVLDFGRPEVAGLDRVAGCARCSRTARISYLKWDMNRPVSDGGRPGDDHGRQWSVQHAEGYYRGDADAAGGVPARDGRGVQRAAAAGSTRPCSPSATWSGRATRPGRGIGLAIQHGFLTAYGPHVMSSWVTDEPDRLDPSRPVSSIRFVVAMAGVLGIGSDLLAWTEDQRYAGGRAGRRSTGAIRTTIHTGRVELHGVPADPVHAVEYGTAEQTVLLVYGRAARTERGRAGSQDAAPRPDATGSSVPDRRLAGAEARRGRRSCRSRSRPTPMWSSSRRCRDGRRVARRYRCAWRPIWSTAAAGRRCGRPIASGCGPTRTPDDRGRAGRRRPGAAFVDAGGVEECLPTVRGRAGPR